MELKLQYASNEDLVSIKIVNINQERFIMAIFCENLLNSLRSISRGSFLKFYRPKAPIMQPTAPIPLKHLQLSFLYSHSFFYLIPLLYLDISYRMPFIVIRSSGFGFSIHLISSIMLGEISFGFDAFKPLFIAFSSFSILSPSKGDFPNNIS